MNNKFEVGDLVRVMNTGLLPSEAIILDRCPKSKQTDEEQWQVFTINGGRFWFVETNLRLIAKAKMNKRFELGDLVRPNLINLLSRGWWGYVYDDTSKNPDYTYVHWFDWGPDVGGFKAIELKSELQLAAKGKRKTATA